MPAGRPSDYTQEIEALYEFDRVVYKYVLTPMIVIAFIVDVSEYFTLLIK